MSWSVPTRSGTFGPQAPPGLHPAVLVALIDLGTQAEEYDHKVRQVPRALFVWELVAEPRPAGSSLPLVAHREFTVSMHENAALRKCVQGRLGRTLTDGEDYSIDRELGQPCFLSIVTDRDYTKIDTVAAVPRGVTVPPATVGPLLWRIHEYANGKTVFPPWIPSHVYGVPLLERIKGCKELKRQEAAPF